MSLREKIQEDIFRIKGNDPEESLKVAKLVCQRLDVIAEAIFLPDYFLSEDEDQYKKFQLFIDCSSDLGSDAVRRLCEAECKPQYTQLHKDITYLFLCKYTTEKPDFLTDNRYTWKALRVFYEKRMVFVTDWFIRKHINAGNEESMYDERSNNLMLEGLGEIKCLHKHRFNWAMEITRADGFDAICPYDLEQLIQAQINDGLVEYGINTGFDLMKNECKSLLGDVKDFHDLIESPAYGSNGVCIKKYDILYKEYFVQRCLQMAQEWDCSSFKNDPDIKLSESKRFNRLFSSRPRLDPDC